MFKWEKRDSNAPTERADFIICWIKNLIDLKAKQTQGRLRDKTGFCCLGNASDMAGYKWTWNGKRDEYVIKVDTREYESYLPFELQRFLKTDSNTGFTKLFIIIKNGITHRYYNLVSMNDDGLSFRQIAKAIQSHCEHMFKNLTEEEQNYIKAYKIPTRQELRNLRKASN